MRWCGNTIRLIEELIVSPTIVSCIWFPDGSIMTLRFRVEVRLYSQERQHVAIRRLVCQIRDLPKDFRGYWWLFWQGTWGWWRHFHVLPKTITTSSQSECDLLHTTFDSSRLLQTKDILLFDKAKGGRERQQTSSRLLHELYTRAARRPSSRTS